MRKPAPVKPDAYESLIAAAPAMLDALKAFYRECGGNPPDWLQEAYAAAENAIAKAEGR